MLPQLLSRLHPLTENVSQYIRHASSFFSGFIVSLFLEFINYDFKFGKKMN